MIGVEGILIAKVNYEAFFGVYCELPNITPVVNGIDEDLDGDGIS